MLRVVSSKNTVRWYALAWIVLYLLTYFVFKDSLPDKYFRDSVTIQELANDILVNDWGGAYQMAAMVAHALPLWAINALVVTIGSCTLWLVITSLRTFRGMLIVIPVLIPMIVLDLMAFGKEVFVIPLTFVIYRIATTTRSPLKAFFVICVIYLLYGIFFRSYYLLILLVFAAYMLMLKSPPILRLVYVFAFVITLTVIPATVYNQLQGSRDMINFYTQIGGPEVRTAIFNPYPPDGGFHFTVNYIYTLIRLTAPILFAQSVNEFALLINVIIYGYLMYLGVKRRPLDAMALLPWLFLAHITILFVFEPDLGSYFRHFSSTVLYLLPTLQMVEQGYVAKFVENNLPKDQSAQTA